MYGFGLTLLFPREKLAAHLRTDRSVYFWTYWNILKDDVLRLHQFPRRSFEDS